MNRPFKTPARQPEPGGCAAIDLLLSLHADGMASPDESRRVEAHLPGCASCRQSLLWMQATRRALAGRPLMPPPAGLQARIAASIAASAAVPVSLRPARVFALRPAFAAAASLLLLGVAGYSLLHSPPARVTPTQPKMPLVAVAPPVKPLLPRVLPLVKPPLGHSLPQPTVIKRVPPTEPRVASRPVDDETDTSLPVTPSIEPPAPAAKPLPQLKENAAPAVKPRPRPILRKKPILASPLMANLPKPPEENHAPPVKTPDTQTPETVATNNVPPTPSAVNITPAPLPPPDSAPVRTASSSPEHRVQTADYILAPVRQHIGQMQTASVTVKFASISGAPKQQFVMVPGVYSH